MHASPSPGPGSPLAVAVPGAPSRGRAEGGKAGDGDPQQQQPQQQQASGGSRDIWGSSLGYATTDGHVSSPSDVAGSEILNSWSSTPALAASKTPREGSAAPPTAGTPPSTRGAPIPLMPTPSSVSTTTASRRRQQPTHCKACNVALPPQSTTAFSGSPVIPLSGTATSVASSFTARKRPGIYFCRICGDCLCPRCAVTKVTLYDSEGRPRTCRVCEGCAVSNPRLQVQRPPPGVHRMSLSSSPAGSPHAVMKYQREKLREAEAELSRLRELESTVHDQDYIGRKAVVAEMESSDDRRRLFEEGKHHCKRCQVCLAKYKMFQREHHCRKCYRSVCAECSRAKIDSLRVCDWCISSPPPALPACATGQSAAMRAAEYQKMAELLWKSSEVDTPAEDDDDDARSETQSRVSTTCTESVACSTAYTASVRCL